MKNLMDKLTTYASLVGVVTAIGGGFYAWGEFNTRLSAIEGSGVDISGISKNAEEIAVINEKIGKLDLSGIAVVEENSKANAKAIDEKHAFGRQLIDVRGRIDGFQPAVVSPDRMGGMIIGEDENDIRTISRAQRSRDR